MKRGGNGAPSVDRLTRRAMHYLARQAASSTRVRQMLTRAVLRAAPEGERPDEDAVAALVDPVMARLDRAGLLDDVAFARSKARSLAEKGRPAGVIKAELKHRHGIEATDDESFAEQLAALDPLTQATRWARRRRLGPFRLRNRAEKRDADIASLARAGFSVGIARSVVDGDGEASRGDDDVAS